MKLKLTYWNFPFWRAEVSRLALHLGGIAFEDYRPSRAEFLALRESGALPFGQLPILEVDGEVFSQTGGIARFCGKLGGFYPRDNDLAAAKIDQILDVATDITNLFGPSMREKDEAKKLALRAELVAHTLPRWLGNLEKLLAANTESEYFVGESLTVADLAIWRMGGWLMGGYLDGIPAEIIEPYPLLKGHYTLMDGEPRIRAWMDSHYA